MKRPLIVCMGVCHRDVELAALWLRWVTFLSRQPGGDHPRILVVFTQQSDPAPMFSAIVGASRIGLVRCPDEQERGYPGSASHLFLRTLEQAEQRFPGHAVLWCEPDTVITRPTWFSEISAEYDACGKPFLGAKVGERFPHLAGNSCYPHNWRELAPSIANVLNASDYKLWGPGKGQPWDVYCRDETTPQMAESKLWHHVWKERDARATRLKDIPAEACIFHQDKTGALIREIAAARYPEFMATLPAKQKFYQLNGHSSRLRAKGVDIRFTFQKWGVGGWRSAVCSSELTDEKASALATLAGHFGLEEITEEAFVKLTGRGPLAPPVRSKPKTLVPVVLTETNNHSHPSVFVMLGRYGDICNILPMLKAEADAGRRPTLVVSQDFADILDGVSYVDRIVWDGAYDRLPDALRWLRKDKGILSPVVPQYHRNPHDKARLTDSYQKEVWRLAGRLDQFAARGPLVFDRRDEKREESLIRKAADVYPELHGVPVQLKKPLILVGLESVSSPLANANAILRAIVERFGETHDVVNLSNVKAERIYDLIALFDASALLIAADTVHIHLARASTVPLIALANTGWRGSVCEHAKEVIRYEDAAPVAVVRAIERALPSPFISVSELATIIKKGQKHFAHERAASTPVSIGRCNDLPEPAIFHVVDVHGSDARHHVAQSTWSMAYAEGITPMHFRGGSRNAKDELGDPRPLPFLKDVLWSAIPADARERGNDIVCWTNGDIGLKSGLAKVLREHVGKHGAASMRRTESNGHGHPGRDLFAFTVDFLHEHWDEIPDYVLGAPAFDLGLIAMIRKFHGLPFSLKSCNDDLAPADMAPGFALHQSHDPEWQVANMDSVPSVRHNKRLLREWCKKHMPEVKFSRGGNLQ